MPKRCSPCPRATGGNQQHARSKPRLKGELRFLPLRSHVPILIAFLRLADTPLSDRHRASTSPATPLREWGKNYLKPKKEVVDEDSDVEAMSSESEDDGEEIVATSGSRQEVIERQTKELERFVSASRSALRVIPFLS